MVHKWVGCSTFMILRFYEQHWAINPTGIACTRSVLGKPSSGSSANQTSGIFTPTMAGRILVASHWVQPASKNILRGLGNNPTSQFVNSACGLIIGSHHTLNLRFV
jgi:hypothetical protein